MRRIDDDIRAICNRLLATHGDEEARPLVVELKAALETKIRRLRLHLANYPRVMERRAKTDRTA